MVYTQFGFFDAVTLSIVTTQCLLLLKLALYLMFFVNIKVTNVLYNVFYKDEYNIGLRYA